MLPGLRPMLQIVTTAIERAKANDRRNDQVRCTDRIMIEEGWVVVWPCEYLATLPGRTLPSPPMTAGLDSRDHKGVLK